MELSQAANEKEFDELANKFELHLETAETPSDWARKFGDIAKALSPLLWILRTRVSMNTFTRCGLYKLWRPFAGEEDINLAVLKEKEDEWFTRRERKWQGGDLHITRYIGELGKPSRDYVAHLNRVLSTPKQKAKSGPSQFFLRTFDDVSIQFLKRGNMLHILLRLLEFHPKQYFVNEVHHTTTTTSTMQLRF